MPDSIRWNDVSVNPNGVKTFVVDEANESFCVEDGILLPKVATGGADAPWYDLQGRRTDLLRKDAVYIRGGKKVIAR